MNRQRVQELRERGEKNGLRTHEVKELFEWIDGIYAAVEEIHQARIDADHVGYALMAAGYEDAHVIIKKALEG